MKMKMGFAMSMMVLVFVGVSFAQPCPQWAMPGPQSGCPDCGCAPVPLAYMGKFEGAWEWNPVYQNELFSWNPSVDFNLWVPRKALNWMPVQAGGPPQLHVQYRNSG